MSDSNKENYARIDRIGLSVALPRENTPFSAHFNLLQV